MSKKLKVGSRVLKIKCDNSESKEMIGLKGTIVKIEWFKQYATIIVRYDINLNKQCWETEETIQLMEDEEEEDELDESIKQYYKDKQSEKTETIYVDVEKILEGNPWQK